MNDPRFWLAVVLFTVSGSYFFLDIFPGMLKAFQGRAVEVMSAFATINADKV
jgi:hypothetical protein